MFLLKLMALQDKLTLHDGVKATNDAAKAKRVISSSMLTQAIERDHSKNH